VVAFVPGPCAWPSRDPSDGSLPYAIRELGLRVHPCMRGACAARSTCSTGVIHDAQKSGTCVEQACQARKSSFRDWDACHPICPCTPAAKYGHGSRKSSRLLESSAYHASQPTYSKQSGESKSIEDGEHTWLGSLRREATEGTL
jgi:hypothetical protein